MKLYEYESKGLFERFGIPVEKHLIYTDQTDEKELFFPCVVKAQVLSGKRGKAGAVQFADTQEELLSKAAHIRTLQVKGKPVDHIMISEKVAILREYYLSLTIDSSNRRAVMLFTPDGGMDIEETAKKTPERLLRIDCSDGFDPNSFFDQAARFGFAQGQLEALGDIAQKLSRLFFEMDALTVEINPLVLTADGKLLAIDAKIEIDDNALFRQGDIPLLGRDEQALTPEQKKAHAAGLEYVELDHDGDIGIIAGGAGIGMATVDTVRHYGGRPFNFLDLGGGVTSEKTCSAMKLLLEHKGLKAILVNVFGGINNCADMARGIQQAYHEAGRPEVKVVVKSRGFSQEIGWEIYAGLGFEQVKYGTTDDAVKKLLSIMEAGNERFD